MKNYCFEIYLSGGDKDSFGDFTEERAMEIYADLKSKGEVFNCLRIEEDNSLTEVKF